MAKLEQIQQSAAGLFPAEMRKFVRWLEEYREAEWERLIEADAEAGQIGRCRYRGAPRGKVTAVLKGLNTKAAACALPA